MSGQAWVVVEAVGVIIAAIAAVGAFVYYRRQALAAEGKSGAIVVIGGTRRLDPTIGTPLTIDVKNLDFRKVHVQRFKFSIPRSLELSHKRSPQGSYVAVSHNVRLLFEIGIAPGQTSRFLFTVRPKASSKLPDKFHIRCAVTYRVDGARMDQTSRGALQILRG